MALKVLLLRNKLSAVNATLAQLREQAAALETRESELAADIEAAQSCKNVAAVLEAAGSSMERVIKTTCYLADMADFPVFNQIYETYFVSSPARSCVAVKTLPKNVLCEIEAIAYKE